MDTRITIHFNTDNDAFVDRKQEETERIINNIRAKVIDFDHKQGSIFDANGNSIGWFKVNNDYK